MKKSLVLALMLVLALGTVASAAEVNSGEISIEIDVQTYADFVNLPTALRKEMVRPFAGSGDEWVISQPFQVRSNGPVTVTLDTHRPIMQNADGSWTLDREDHTNLGYHVFLAKDAQGTTVDGKLGQVYTKNNRGISQDLYLILSTHWAGNWWEIPSDLYTGKVVLTIASID